MHIYEHSYSNAIKTISKCEWLKCYTVRCREYNPGPFFQSQNFEIELA